MIIVQAHQITPVETYLEGCAVFLWSGSPPLLSQDVQEYNLILPEKGRLVKVDQLEVHGEWKLNA